MISKDSLTKHRKLLDDMIGNKYLLTKSEVKEALDELIRGTDTLIDLVGILERSANQCKVENDDLVTRNRRLVNEKNELIDLIKPLVEYLKKEMVIRPAEAEFSTINKQANTCDLLPDWPSTAVYTRGKESIGSLEFYSERFASKNYKRWDVAATLLSGAAREIDRLIEIINLKNSTIHNQTQSLVVVRDKLKKEEEKNKKLRALCFDIAGCLKDKDTSLESVRKHIEQVLEEDK